MVKHRIVLTGGGTGGHIYPALSVAEKLKEDPSLESILYIGARGHLEERLARDRDLDFLGLEVAGMPRKIQGALLSWPFKLGAAVVEARRALLDFAPTAVLGTGGYASAPALLAAGLLKIPFAIHEPDAHPGLVNRLMARWATLVSCGMQGAANQLRPAGGRLAVNGNPVGKSFVEPLKRDAACAILGLKPDLKTVLVTGGSQGARAINEAVFKALPELLALEPPIQIIHQVGEKNIQECKERLEPSCLNNSRYFLRDYFDDLSIPYACADVTICRAGAMTLAELSVMGVPAIFVPFPHAAADHQTHNARYMAGKGAALLVPQSPEISLRLKDELLALLKDDERLRSMRKAMSGEGKPQAAADICDQLKELSTAHQIKLSKESARV